MNGIKTLDGSFSLQVSQHVKKNADGDPLWTARFLMTDPDAVCNAHLDFLKAGSDIIETDTYQASVDGFAKYLGYSFDESQEIIIKAVDLAKDAIGMFKKDLKVNDEGFLGNLNPQVAGSCGPYGATLHNASEYTGVYDESITKEFLKEWHRSRIEILIKAGVDMLAIETIPCAREAEAVVELMKEFPDTKAWLSFSCSNDGITIADGSKFEDIAKLCCSKADPNQLIAIGVNCLSPHNVTSYLSKIKDNQQLVPLIAYPNSGEIYTTEEGWKDGGNPFLIDKYVHEWLNLGVKFIGGCCRTSDADIKTIRQQINIWKARERETTV